MTPWIIDCQAPLSMRFPKQEYWSELPFPYPRDLANPEIKSTSPELQAISCTAGRFFTTESPGILIRMRGKVNTFMLGLQNAVLYNC